MNHSKACQLHLSRQTPQPHHYLILPTDYSNQWEESEERLAELRSVTRARCSP